MTETLLPAQRIDTGRFNIENESQRDVVEYNVTLADDFKIKLMFTHIYAWHIFKNKNNTPTDPCDFYRGTIVSITPITVPKGKLGKVPKATTLDSILRPGDIDSWFTSDGWAIAAALNEINATNRSVRRALKKAGIKKYAATGISRLLPRVMTMFFGTAYPFRELTKGFKARIWAALYPKKRAKILGSRNLNAIEKPESRPVGRERTRKPADQAHPVQSVGKKKTKKPSKTAQASVKNGWKVLEDLLIVHMDPDRPMTCAQMADLAATNGYKSQYGSKTTEVTRMLSRSKCFNAVKGTSPRCYKLKVSAGINKIEQQETASAR